MAQVGVLRERERCSGRRSRQGWELSLSLHGKAVVTRSVLRLVTGANADDERADAGYAASGDGATDTAFIASRLRITTSDPATTMRRPRWAWRAQRGWDRESGFGVVACEDTERRLGLWRRDSGERYPYGWSSSK